MLNRRRWLQAAAQSLAACSLLERTSLFAQEEAAAEYRSPYELRFRHPREELEVGWDRAPWNTPGEESSIPHDEWYSPRVRREWGAWGPPARQYPAAPGLERRSATWLQDRVILAAKRHIGIPYQHHHIPAWDPPADWKWIKVAYGRNSRGVDCSNFSSFYYNYALGLKLDTAIGTQAERREVKGPGGEGVLRIARIEPQPYDELIRTLRPADLLFIKNDAGRVGHVILWLGEVGVSPDGLPLVIDSTGGNHRDSNGNKIPIGVHIRPFGPKSWYFGSFSHAHRLIDAVSEVEEGDAAEPQEGGEEVSE